VTLDLDTMSRGAGGGRPPARVAALTPTESSPWGQWSLTADAPQGGLNLYPDRSGNARDLSGGGTTIPDLRPYPAAAVTYQPGLSPPSTSQYFAADSLFEGLEFTFTIRACFATYYATAGDSILIGADGYKVLFHPYADLRLAHLPYLEAAVYSTLQWLPGQWAYYSIRRMVDGTIRFGVNDTFENIVCPQPTPVYTRLTVGASLSYGGSDPWLGPSADMTAWGSYLSDADIERFAGISLGT
jgi:hypothetical protein